MIQLNMVKEYNVIMYISNRDQENIFKFQSKIIK
jgi:hypothetical protein